jgi:hypothetical protein
MHDPGLHHLAHDPQLLIVPQIESTEILYQKFFPFLDDVVHPAIVNVKEGFSRKLRNLGLIRMDDYLGVQRRVEV